MTEYSRPAICTPQLAAYSGILDFVTQYNKVNSIPQVLLGWGRYKEYDKRVGQLHWPSGLEFTLD